MITGYPDENIAAKASSVGVRQVLLKPNLEDRLVECVRSAINPGRAAGQP
jgi:DNA-binding NarL/FixJ family response regulator